MIQKSHSIKNGMPEAAVKYQPYPQIALADRTWPSKTHYPGADLVLGRPA